MAMTLPAKRVLISSGMSLLVDVHHTLEYVELIGPWYLETAIITTPMAYIRTHPHTRE